MKLLYCKSCNDAFALRTIVKMCECGKSAGVYQEDLLFVKVTGPSLVLGMRNRDVRAFEYTIGKNLTYWVIDETRPDCHIVRTDTNILER